MSAITTLIVERRGRVSRCARPDGARRDARRAQLPRGLSLLEVLLALAILGGALAAIGELMRAGARSAELARDLSIAQLLSDTVMSEISAGLIPLQAVSGAAVNDPQFQAEWSYSVVIEPLGQDGLIAVSVTVQQDPRLYSRPASFTLVRWMIDPQMIAQTTELL